MASLTHSLPLTRDSVLQAHELIKPHVHLTPIQTNTTLSLLASTPQSPSALEGTPWEGEKPAELKMRELSTNRCIQGARDFSCGAKIDR
jgi:threonine dehydratase